MPKNPGGISKSERMQAVIDLLNRAGLLEKNEITQRVASHLNVESDVIDRALYRDLNELVDSGKIKVCSKDSIGQIVNPELDDIKNFKNYWYTDKFSPFDITGIGHLSENNFNFITHASLQTYIECKKVINIKDSVAHVIFPTARNCLGLHFNKEIFPLNLFLSRIEDLSKEFKNDFFRNMVSVRQYCKFRIHFFLDFKMMPLKALCTWL